jgi:elongation factor Ts
MADFTAKDVQALRKATGAGMMDAKRALEESDGDAEAAADWLREKGLSKAAGRSDRENAEGAVAVARDGDRAALVELKSETDFSAKADDFTGLVQDLADLVLAKGVDAIAERADDIDQLKILKKENIEVGVVALYEAAAGGAIDAYVHSQDGRGKVGVLIEVSDADEDAAHQIALHIAFAKPTYLRRDEVPGDAVDKERAFLEQQTRDEGKPEQALPKIVEGKLRAFFKESVLLEQDLFGEKKSPVAGALDGGDVVRFTIASVGA